MPTFYVAPTANFVQTSLNGSITDSQTTITLNSTANMQAPGYIVIDRVDSNNTATANSREVVSYTGISGQDLTGCTRGADNSTARSHSSGAIVETTPTIGAFNSLATILATAVTSDGYLKAINSPVSISIGRFTQFDTPSIASITEARVTRLVSTNATISGSLNAGSASITGFGLVKPVFVLKGNFSGPTTNPLGPLVLTETGTWDFFSAITPRVASGASAILDVNLNGTSIFDASTRLAIVGGGTFVSTASIATKAFTRGGVLTVDYDTTGGFITDVIVQGRST